jgi:hypothetical protein
MLQGASGLSGSLEEAVLDVKSKRTPLPNVQTTSKISNADVNDAAVTGTANLIVKLL